MPISPGAEDSVFQAASAGLKRWLTRARDAVMAPWRKFKAQPDPTAIAATVPFWREQVDRIVESLEPAIREGWAAAHLPGDVDLKDPYVQANLALTHNLLVRIPDEVHAMVVREILRGTANGETVQQIADRVDNVLSYSGSENWPNRAKVIAQTECLVADTRIDAAEVATAYKRSYRGPLVTISTENGRTLTGTPNHPVLTSNGWMSLRDLSEFDYLVCDSACVQYAATSRYPDVEAPPISIVQIFDTLQAIGIVERVTGREPDFHGDGAHGNVNVASTFGALWVGGGEPSIKEGVVDLILKGALSELCSMRPFGVSGKLDIYSDQGGLRSIPRGYPVSAQGPTESCCTNSEVVSDSDCRIAAYISIGNSFDVKRLLNVQRLAGADHGRRARSPHLDASTPKGREHRWSTAVVSSGYESRSSAPHIQLDKLRDIRLVEDSSHVVYNLSTTQGFFVANGIYTKNCNRHFNSSMLAHGLLRERDGARGLLKQWDTRMDNHERPAHHEANNQVQPLSQPFLVGGEMLQFPVDPTGRPDNVISCRCELRLINASGRAA